MSREEMINTTRAILAKAGFDISSAIELRSICFDVVGRRDKTLLIIKVLSNVDAFSRENAEEMKVLADALGASPVLIGETSSSGLLEKGIVYTRFKIQIISNETLAEHLLEEVPPFIFAAPGGLYVKVNSDLLKQLREERGISLGTLAETAGVSRRTIQMYEAGMGAMIDAALRLEEFLNVPIIQAVDPFDYKSRHAATQHEIKGPGKAVGSPALDRLLDIGFAITPVVRGPFEAITRDQQMVLLTGLGSDESKLVQKALIASELSTLADKHAVVIVQKKQRTDSIKSTALITDDELNKIDDKDELTDIILSRSTRK
ncbi:MAG: transcriptional regulator [Candidatus Methanomethylophilus sp.]|nr:transcriptional regulator [Methanomethylophilus sp.]MDD3233236.1 transcriptional regulator [Methanomethylophilus sp.]MDD4222377.1 transcriptional regulator [Methanomethylophilus sp.]MDD4668664.1 transcriptional regulator [Methanomethylophilus sp.]